MKKLALLLTALVLTAAPAAAQTQTVETIDDAFKALESPDGDKRAEGALFLSGVLEATQFALTKALQDPDQKEDAKAALDSMLRGSLRALRQGLSSDNRETRKRSAAALLLLGRRADSIVPALDKALLDDSRTVRLAICQTLAKIGKPAAVAVPNLIKALNEDTSTTVRKEATRALIAIGPSALAAVPSLAQAAVGSRDEELRPLAAQALGAIGPKAKPAIKALTAALRDEVLEVRLAAAKAIGRVGTEDEEAKAELARRAKGDPSGQVRAAAAQTLQRLK